MNRKPRTITFKNSTITESEKPPEVRLYPITEGYHQGKHCLAIDEPGFLILDLNQLIRLCMWMSDYTIGYDGYPDYEVE